MASRRTERVGEEIQKELARLLQFEIRDPRVGMVTITDVKVSPDLRLARVYYSLLGDDSEQQRQETLKGLMAARGFMRHQLTALRLRYLPELQFHYDASGAYAIRIGTLLNQIHERAPREGGIQEPDGDHREPGSDSPELPDPQS